MQTLRLRGILEWRNEVTSSVDQPAAEPAEVLVLIWPAGDFKRLPFGTTASEVVRAQVSNSLCGGSKADTHAAYSVSCLRRSTGRKDKKMKSLPLSASQGEPLGIEAA